MEVKDYAASQKNVGIFGLPSNSFPESMFTTSSFAKNYYQISKFKLYLNCSF